MGLLSLESFFFEKTSRLLAVRSLATCHCDFPERDHSAQRPPWSSDNNFPVVVGGGGEPGVEVLPWICQQSKERTSEERGRAIVRAVTVVGGASLADFVHDAQIRRLCSFACNIMGLTNL
jgi:hypothetical protein